MIADTSVIIPAYNRAELIVETLRSILNQSVSAKEIIVVDDGSTDETAEAAEREFSVFSEQFSVKANIQKPTFKILRQENAGPGAARNRGLAEATGEFIHFFDSDDIASPNKHAVQLRALLETGADIVYGPWCKGRFVNLTTENSEEMRGVKTDVETQVCAWAGRQNFVPKGPVLQADGLPEGDLVRALLTNWSIVPHACLFRRSILERVGGFPEDIWVGEDQLLFLRCLLAGAKVVHTTGTMVFYRVGNDLGKLTAAGTAQKRHARDWGKFLIKANQEVTRKGKHLTTKLTRSTRGPASYLLPVTDKPSAWFAFRLRAYEAWRDLEKFFPKGEDELKKELLGIWRRNIFSGFRFSVSGFLLRKLGGTKLRVVGYRESASFQCRKISLSALYESDMK